MSIYDIYVGRVWCKKVCCRTILTAHLRKKNSELQLG